MKNEKFCFSKGTGLIAVTGIVLIGVVLAMQMVGNVTTSTSTRAATSCPTDSAKDYINKCPKNLLVLDENKKNVTEELNGKKYNCCYYPTAFSQQCPTGSIAATYFSCPDVWTVKDVNKKPVYAVRAITGKKYNCCSWDAAETTNGKLSDSKIARIPTKIPVRKDTSRTQVDVTEAVLPAQSVDFCKKNGLYNANVVYGKFYYQQYCSENINHPTWNKPKCYAAIGLCGSNENCDKETCMRGQSSTVRCLNMEVPFSYCLAAGVVDAKDAPDYTGMLCDANATCDGEVAINSCAPQSTKRCVCKTGMNYPSYEEDTRADATKCTTSAPTVNCTYGTKIVSARATSTSPYTYTLSAKNVRQCIQKDNKNIGYRCKTDKYGVINATGSVADSVDCPVPVTTCSSKDAEWKAQNYKCSDKYPYDVCVQGGYKCKCGDQAYPTLETDDFCTVNNSVL